MISYDAVVQAINQILMRGDRPSVRSIRAELGHGSHGTISAHFKRYRDERAGMDKETPTAPEIAALASLAPDLTARLRAAFQAQVTRDMSLAAERQQASDRQIEELNRLLTESEAAAAQATATLAERTACEERQIAATQASTDAIQAALAAMHAEVRNALLECVETQRQIEQRAHERQEALMDIAKSVIHQNAASQEVVLSTIRAQCR